MAAEPTAEPAPGGDPLPALKRLLAQRSDALAHRAVADAGQVDADEAAALRQLAELVDHLEQARPKPQRSRTPLIVALGVAAVSVFALSVLRVGQTEVVMELGVSELSMRLAAPQRLTPALALSGLGVSGAESIELPSELDPALRAAAGEASAALRLDPAVDAAHAGRIDLGPIALPAGARIGLSTAAGPGRYRISLTDAAGPLSASVRGPLRYTVAGQASPASQTHDAIVPRPVVIRVGAASVDLDLVLAEARATGLVSPIEIDGLSLQHIDAPVAGTGADAPPAAVSSLRGGTLYWAALDGQERKLLPHELLGFEQIRGQISALRLEPDQIGLRVQASVRGLTLGSGDNRRSLMPTWLDWLRQRHGLSLFWGSAIYLFGLMAGVMRWWRSPS